MPRQPTISRIIYGHEGMGRRLAHCRRSPSHPPHAPTTDNITHHRTGTRGMGTTSRPLSQISVPSPSCPDNRQYHASSYGHEGDGGDVSPIVADLRPIPLMPRQPTISRIIVRARGGWGRRLAHCRRSPSHPPHAPTTDNITHHRTGTRGMGTTSRPLSQISVPSPSCPDNRQYHASSYGHEGMGRRLAHCRRSPSHPPHAPTTVSYALVSRRYVIRCGRSAMAPRRR